VAYPAVKYAGYEVTVVIKQSCCHDNKDSALVEFCFTLSSHQQWCHSIMKC